MNLYWLWILFKKAEHSLLIEFDKYLEGYFVLTMKTDSIEKEITD